MKCVELSIIKLCKSGKRRPNQEFITLKIPKMSRVHSASNRVNIKLGKWAITEGMGGGEIHEALVQVKPILGYRDLHKSYKREGQLYTGLYDINQHHGSDMPFDNISYYAAGCLVGRTSTGHQEFMSLLKQDVRYKKAPNFLFTTTVILGHSL